MEFDGHAILEFPTVVHVIQRVTIGYENGGVVIRCDCSFKSIYIYIYISENQADCEWCYSGKKLGWTNLSLFPLPPPSTENNIMDKVG